MSTKGRTLQCFRGHPHHDYYRNRAICDAVFVEFPSIERGSFAQLSRRRGIAESTIRGWYKHWLSDANWRPYDGKPHGMHHRIFTDAQERAISCYIRDNDITPGYAFHDQDFRIIAMQAYLEIVRDYEKIRFFECSPHFISNYKDRWGYSTRKARFKRRPSVSQETIDAWNAEMRGLLSTPQVDMHHILNADETCWTILPHGAVTWAEKGSDGVNILTQDDDKQAITAMATISAAGDKLPLFLIAKGLTERCERSQLGEVHGHHAAHAPGGWMTGPLFLSYLRFLRSQFSDGKTLHLVVDAYAAHRTQVARELAASHNIKLHYLPAGMTDLFQPLDRRCFGCLKATAKHYVWEFLRENPSEKIGLQQAVQILFEELAGIVTGYNSRIMGHIRSHSRSIKQTDHQQLSKSTGEPLPLQRMLRLADSSQ